MKKVSVQSVFALPAAFAAVFALVAATVSGSALGADSVFINGAGATFPYPIYSKWFSQYRSVDPSVTINYQSIGSGGGIRQLLDRTVDFGASDAPMKDSEMQKAEVPILHIPTVLGAVAVSYNLPEVKKELRLSPDVVADIFLGKIRKWNDPRLAKENPGVNLPDQHILVAHRSDGSGTTSVFTDYLAKVSPEWAKKVGAGKAVKWPVGIGGKGNEGVAGLIKQSPGTIGYIEQVYAETNRLPVAAIRNAEGAYVKPSAASASAAADGALKSMPADYRVSITDARGNKNAYPIAAFTYLLVYQQMPKEKGAKLVKFLEWAMGPGQKMAEPLSYAPLPKSLVAKVKKTIATIELK